MTTEVHSRSSSLEESAISFWRQNRKWEYQRSEEREEDDDVDVDEDDEDDEIDGLKRDACDVRESTISTPATQFLHVQCTSECIARLLSGSVSRPVLPTYVCLERKT